MITQKQLMEYAIKGLVNDVEKLDNKIIKGNKYIEDKLNGSSNSPLSIEELKSKVNELKEEKQKLVDMINQIKWDLTDYS